VSVPARRRQVAYGRERGLSARRACTLFSVARSALRCRGGKAAKDAAVIEQMGVCRRNISRRTSRGSTGNHSVPSGNGPGRCGAWAIAPWPVAQPAPRGAHAASKGRRLKLTVVRRIGPSHGQLRESVYYARHRLETIFEMGIRMLRTLAALVFGTIILSTGPMGTFAAGLREGLGPPVPEKGSSLGTLEKRINDGCRRTCIVHGWRRRLPRICPDGISCFPLYGAYGPYGGPSYWAAYTYSGWAYRY
jgi:hypothetical protein